ncbi:MAG: type II toxin-antitoxin system VapC family toxin [Balneolaceae bacterium]|nr:type II toxin-antitoxin system VapC family toxin [Balneolaceae bacterium]MCH8548516.1 type II toxin-antitoxin system VapC family toxin [Balneolaceae bacterium]
MNAPVIDACVAIKWFLPEEGFEEAGSILNSHNRMIVPDLFFIEFDAIVTKKVRQQLVEPEDSSLIIQEIRKLPLEVISYSKIHKLAFDLSSALPITQYDACYLSVAIEFNQKVITADKRFFKGMRYTPYHNLVEVL